VTTVRASADVLEDIWQKFKAAAAAEDIQVSKQATSKMRLATRDAHLLARWTRPGDRKNWRIPFWRIPEVCDALQAPATLREELFLARLYELEEDAKPQHCSELVALEWGLELGREEKALSPDEQHVLTQWRAAAKNYPRGLFYDAEETEFLERHFRELLAGADKVQSELDRMSSDEQPLERREKSRQAWEDWQTRKKAERKARREGKSRAFVRDQYLRGAK
jgi:hypothetical protein